MTLNWTAYDSHDRLNSRRVRFGTYTGPASYVTGGETPDKTTELGLSNIHDILFGVAFDGTNANFARYNRSTGKVQWIVGSSGAEVANGVDLSTFTCFIVVFGT